MAKTSFVELRTFCQLHEVEYEFIYSLCESGYIESKNVREEIYLNVKHIGLLEKIVRLHLDLGINSQGIGAVLPLVNRIDELQQEIKSLQNKLYLYENEMYK